MKAFHLYALIVHWGNRVYCKQRCKEEGQGGAIPRTPNHCGAPNRCRGRRKVPTMSQVLSSTAHLLPKNLRSNMGAPNLLLPRAPS